MLPTKYDFNGEVVFECPRCHSLFILFVALHNDGDGLKVCLQRTDAEGVNGIPLSWWQSNP